MRKLIAIAALLTSGLVTGYAANHVRAADSNLPAGCTKVQGTITCVTPAATVGNSDNFKGGNTTTSQGNLSNKQASTSTCTKNGNGACQP